MEPPPRPMSGTPRIEQPNRLETIPEIQANDTEFMEVLSIRSTPWDSPHHSRQSSIFEHKVISPQHLPMTFLQSAVVPLELAIHSHNQLSSTIALIKRKFLLVHESNLPLKAKLALMCSLR